MHATIPEGIVGGFEITALHRNFERMAREAMDICFRALKRSSKSRLDSYTVRNSVLIISYITFRGCCVHFFPDNLSPNSCKYNSTVFPPSKESEVTVIKLYDYQ